MAPTSAKAARQPRASPIQADSGTPTTTATVSPIMICPTAAARRPGGASPAATSAATPK